MTRSCQEFQLFGPYGRDLLKRVTLNFSQVYFFFLILAIELIYNGYYCQFCRINVEAQMGPPISKYQNLCCTMWQLKYSHLLFRYMTLENSCQTCWRRLSSQRRFFFYLSAESHSLHYSLFTLSWFPTRTLERTLYTHIHQGTDHPLALPRGSVLGQYSGYMFFYLFSVFCCLENLIRY